MARKSASAGSCPRNGTRTLANHLAPHRKFTTGSLQRRTQCSPIERMIPGWYCDNPNSPARPTAPGFPDVSAATTAAQAIGSTPARLAASSMSGQKCQSLPVRNLGAGAASGVSAIAACEVGRLAPASPEREPWLASAARTTTTAAARTTRTSFSLPTALDDLSEDEGCDATLRHGPFQKLDPKLIRLRTGRL